MDDEGKLMISMLTGIRKNDPGKGRNATFGGFLECDHLLDSPKYTALKEAGEESGLDVGILDENLREDYSEDEVEVMVKNFNIPVRARLIFHPMTRAS